MDATPLETAVRARLDKETSSIVGSQPGLDVAAVTRMVDAKVRLVLPILRESMADDASPSIDHIHRAELEATRRSMKEMIGFMTDPAGQAAANAAKRELDATVGPELAPDTMADEVQARLAELESRLQT